MGPGPLPTDPNAIAGPASNAATFDYEPITGQRDALGYLRVDDPNVPNVGFGSNPCYDIGAYEFVGFELKPPHVTGDARATVSALGSST